MSFLLRFGAVCGALSGLFIAVPGALEAFTGETLATSLVIGVSPALSLPLLTALHLAQRHTAGRLATSGYAVNVVGLGLFGAAAYALNVVLFPLGVTPAAPTRVALLASAAVFAVGCVWFAAGMLRAGVHPRVPVWIYLVVLPVFTLAARLPDTPLISALHVLVGGALVWLAVSVYPKAATADPAPSSTGYNVGTTL
ncbi:MULTISPECIES: hypothetical protein [unclassified Saccharothrix]|uniref:hypothetical protein n=1 Tax=unclassified Saccharothrix TaxID=2593673 RepID=UPI00307E697A